MPHGLISDTIRSEIEELRTTFSAALLEMGFEGVDTTMPAFEACKFAAVNDDYDGEERITGRWLDDEGQQIAHFIRYANGSLFAEKDVLKAHPAQPEHFVEVIEVWGRPGNLKREARLLPAL